MAAVAPSPAAVAPLPPPTRARHRRVTPTRASPISVRSTAAASSLVAPVPDSNFGRVVDGTALLSLPHAERRAVLREALARAFDQLLARHCAGRDLGDRHAGRLGDEGNRTAGARVDF